jgi:hypothetical protein
VELNVVAQIDAAFGHSRFVLLFQMDVVLVLLDPGLQGVANLANVDLTTLAGHAVDISPKKIPSFLWSVKDNLGHRTPGVYSVSYECGEGYSGQTEHSIETRIKEH